MSTSYLGQSGGFGGGLCGGEDHNPHPAVAAVAEVANLLDEAKRLSLFRGNYGGGGFAIQSLEKLGRDLCTSLDNLSRQIDVASQTLNRFIDSQECLPPVEVPVVLMKEESGERRTSSNTPSKKDRNRSTPDVADCMHSNGHGQLSDEIEKG